MVKTAQLIGIGVAMSVLAACSAGSGPCSWAGAPVCGVKQEVPPPPPPPMKKAALPDPCAGNITLPNVTFGVNSADIGPASAIALDQVADALRGCPNRHIRIEAHTDSTGSEAYNQALSDRRAASVRSYLVDHGVNGDALESKGFGESDPVADNSTAAGRAQNRRVELNHM